MLTWATSELDEASDIDARVRAVISTMRRSMGEQWSMRALSKTVNLSATRLRQLFKKETAPVLFAGFLLVLGAIDALPGEMTE